MTFDFADVQFQTFIMRMINALVILMVCIELFKSSTALDNPRLMRIVWKGALYVGIFFLARILAGFADSIFVFSIGWSSNIVTLAFWGYVFYKVRTFRKILQSAKTEPERIALRNICDELIDQLESAKAKLKAIHNS